MCIAGDATDGRKRFGECIGRTVMFQCGLAQLDYFFLLLSLGQEDKGTFKVEMEART